MALLLLLKVKENNTCEHGHDYHDLENSPMEKIEKLLTNAGSSYGSREDIFAADSFKFLVSNLKTKASLFNLRCMKCCYQYLVNERNYRYGDSFDTSVNRVQYGMQDLAEVRMYVDFPHQAKKGVVKVDKMDDEHATLRPLQDSQTYQFYKDDNEYESGKLSDLHHGKLRREAIRFDKIDKAEQLDLCYFSYCDAALLERWRESEGKDSLKGICIAAPDNAALPPAAVMTPKQEPMDY